MRIILDAAIQFSSQMFIINDALPWPVSLYVFSMNALMPWHKVSKPNISRNKESAIRDLLLTDTTPYNRDQDKCSNADHICLWFHDEEGENS